MHPHNLIIRTKLTPPRLHKRILPRPRLTQRLLEALDYRLTIVQAGTGYGKSTALASLAASDHPLVWYHLGEEDADPLVFLLHLLASFRARVPAISDAPLAVLDDLDSNHHLPWTAFVDLLINELAEHLTAPTLLVLDDAHELRQAAELLSILDRFIDYAPAHLHIILSTRRPLKLPSLLTWRVKGAVLEIGQETMAFTPEEIAALFREQYGIELPPATIAQIAAETEGWAIALQLVWQGLHSGAISDVQQALRRLQDGGDSEEHPLVGPTEHLFAYLAQEILDQQSQAIQDFLLTTAVLREMTAPLCDCLRDSDDSAAVLRDLMDSGLFVVDKGDGHLRYHHLFRDFLRHQQTSHFARQTHRKAATCCQRHDQPEETIYHLLKAAAYEDAAEILATRGRRMVRAGRLDTLAGWINALAPDVLQSAPRLLTYLGDIARLHSRFDEALGWYRQAEQQARAQGDQSAIGQALRGQARIYLDTVNPSQAEDLLSEALHLSDGQADREAQARLLELMAENRLNLGHPAEAEAFQAEAQALRAEGPGQAELAVRVMLRTGQLDQARRVLEKRAQAERQDPVLRPRAHRETLLLLALILVFQGEGEAAYHRAIEGTERGEALASPFITAVGKMRQGHGWLLRDAERGYAEACRCYRDAIRRSETLAVPRLKVEAYWGLCRAHGFRGAIDAAERAAERGLALARAAGDEWIATLILVSLGAGYMIAGQYEKAAAHLVRARNGFHECGDTYGQAVARLWQCLLWLETDDPTRLARGLDDLLHHAREHRYDFLFTRATLLGPPNPRRLAPLLLYARDQRHAPQYAKQRLADLGLAQIQHHPGYQLHVQTLGSFRAWRGAALNEHEIEAQDWHRENARLLFLLLITYRDAMLDREQIAEMLWPGLDQETALRDFKVALSTLYKALEPGRKRGAPSAYVQRDGSLYGLRPEADLWLDVDAFERAVAAGDAQIEAAPATGIARYREALNLYAGDYLQEYPFEDWCSEERARLRSLYVGAADQLARALIERAQWSEAIEVCQAILAYDDCWEQAYRLMMTAYARLGNRAQLLRTYRRCEARLREELDVAPSPRTLALYKRLSQES